MGQDFSRMVWALASKIPKGKVSTYAEVARALGKPRAARAVGNALNRNPFPHKAPCYRVVGSNGSVGGYAKGAKRKGAMLRADGIEIKNGRIQDFERYLFKLSKR